MVPALRPTSELGARGKFFASYISASPSGKWVWLWCQVNNARCYAQSLAQGLAPCEGFLCGPCCVAAPGVPYFSLSSTSLAAVPLLTLLPQRQGMFKRWTQSPHAANQHDFALKASTSHPSDSSPLPGAAMCPLPPWDPCAGLRGLQGGRLPWGAT